MNDQTDDTRKVEFKLNKESTYELRAETEADVDNADQTASCCVGCNTGEGVTSGCR